MSKTDKSDRARVCLAIDCGASSSRVMAVRCDGGSMGIEEVHRFPTPSFERDGHCHWDIAAILGEIESGLAAGVRRHGAEVCSVGVDTWGVDYVLLDAGAGLLQEPYQYRDERTSTVGPVMDGRMGPAARFAATGTQDQFFNTLNQLVADQVVGDRLLDRAAAFLFVPDYILFHLSGVMANEFSIASTAQLLEAGTGRYSEAVFGAFGLNRAPFQRVVQPGTVLGPLKPELAARIGAGSEIAVVAVGTHDTASAFAAAPLVREDTVFISSGTWSLLGVERSGPVVTESARLHGFSNEGGVEGTTRLLKNIVGLWMIQECLREWNEQGADLTYAALDEAAAAAPGGAVLLDMEHEPFFKPGDMPDKIRAFCQQSGQTPPEGRGAVVRAIQDSLALTYRRTIDDLESITGSRYSHINIVGGGSQSDLLNQITADLGGRTVHAGPVEASALGNALMQLKAVGAIASRHEGRDLIARHFPLKTCTPRDVPGLAEIRARFDALVAG